MKLLTKLKCMCALIAGLCVGTAVEASTEEILPRVVALDEEANSAVAAQSIEQEFILLTVDKTSLSAELRTWPQAIEAARTLKNFTVAIGKEKGDKQKKGDNRTPEGIYFTRKILDGGRLPAKYGPNAITLNYPNPIDVVNGKTGYGIWLHGVINDERVEEANVTEGCVAFYNSDIKQLTEWLQPGQGLVVIAKDVGTINQPRDVASVRQSTEAWIAAWANRELQKYISYYSERFIHNGMGIDQYRDYKKRVFNSYRVMKVIVDNLRVVTHPKYAVALMDQDFYGDKRFESIGRKILYWERVGNAWKIRREVFENDRVKLVRFVAKQDKRSRAGLAGGSGVSKSL